MDVILRHFYIESCSSLTWSAILAYSKKNKEVKAIRKFVKDLIALKFKRTKRS